MQSLLSNDATPPEAVAGSPKPRRPGRRAKIPPLLVPAPEAARLCGVSPRTWATLNTLGKTPRAVRLSGRVLWNRRELTAWVDAGCPARIAWEAMRAAKTPAGRPRPPGPPREAVIPNYPPEAPPRTRTGLAHTRR